MSAPVTFKISDAVRDVLARSTITATSVKLPDGQLERKLYEAVNKALAGAGGKWNRKAGAHLFDRDPREVLGLAVETGRAVNVKATLQAFYTPKPLADRVAAKAKLKHGMYVLEPSAGRGALVIAAGRIASINILTIDIDPEFPKSMDAINERLRDTGAVIVSALVQDFLTVKPDAIHDAVLMNPPFSGGQDMEHVTHAWAFVKPGGVLVAIMWPAWQTATTKAAVAFRALVDSAASSKVEDIEAGTFADTPVRTVMLVMRKPEAR